MPPRRAHTFIIAAAILSLSGAVGHAANPALQFNRDIRAILSENCFACHGFDAKKRKADLRLDTAEGAYTAIKDEFPIKPGDLAKSTVWQRIMTTDEDELMPPAESHKKLTVAQKDTLKRWIEQGAPYQKHWAFEAPLKPKAANSIDAWLALRLASENQKPAPEADRSTLIRRVSFTVTGLPPTLAEVDTFIADTSPQAYEAMVDRYMKSPRYGEEMARHWLDVARYADTHGLHLDNERSMWAYRDWVVRAFNDNLPFDQFTVWQLAGDLLPNATPDQITATGFSRCNVTTSEGGAIDDEYRHLYAVDRASTLTQAWLGLTGGCAQCHDHKFDPITTKEFYSLYAFFYSSADPPMDGNIANTMPVMKLPLGQQQQALDTAIKAEAMARAALDAAAAKGKPNLEARSTSGETTIEDVLFDDTFPLGIEVKNTSRNPSVWDDKPSYGAKSGHRTLRLSNGHYCDESIDFALKPITLAKQPKLSIWARLDPLSPPRAIAIALNGRRFYWGAEGVMDGPQLGSASGQIHSGPLPKLGEWTLLSVDPTALGFKPGTAINKVSMQQIGGSVSWDKCSLTGTPMADNAPLMPFEQWWKSTNKKASPDLLAALADTFKAGPDAVKDEVKRKALSDFYIAVIARPFTPEIAQLRSAWEAARATRQAAESAITSTFVFKDMTTPRDTFIAERGQYTKLGDKVEPSVPTAFSPFIKAKPDARATRLDLAHWLVSAQQPLTARVTVNRYWQQIFGIGLAKTSHDLGSQGEPPSHPELLDWLAVTFRESGWNVRQLIRSMVTSAAYKQQSIITPEALAQDQDNRLLARGPRLRLDAEQIRDNALFVSGLINLEVGGRGALTYQPPNIWEPVGYENSNTRYYLQQHGPALYRRSLYTFLKRTAPPPFMSNFDAPNREQSCTRRERSNTPMQALQLMNDVQHFEAARALAERVLGEAKKEDSSRLAWLFRTVLARSPDARETTLLLEALAKQRQLYQADPAAANQAIHTGESQPKDIAPAPETAAWTMLANLVLNLDETVTRN